MNSIERIVLQAIGENPDAPDVFTDDSVGMLQIRDSINDAIEEISIITGGLKGRYQMPLRSYRSFYRFDYSGGDIAWITDAWVVGTQRRLEQTDIIKLSNFSPRWMLESGIPRAYVPIGFDHVCLWPKPARDTGMVEFTCVVVPKRYTIDDERLNIRQDLDQAAAEFAIGEYYASRGDARSAISHHTRYMKMVGIDAPYYPTDRHWQLRSNKDPWPKATV
jgi:hypothetical protein